ncbi:MAG TPA: hypothetical protein VF278_15025, partial [Pirellulales bacterium]
SEEAIRKLGFRRGRVSWGGSLSRLSLPDGPAARPTTSFRITSDKWGVDEPRQTIAQALVEHGWRIDDKQKRIDDA